MKKPKDTFASIMLRFNYHHDLRRVFDDFLTMTLCAFSINPKTGKSWDESLYVEIIGKYKQKEERDRFPQLVALLTIEMEEQYGSSSGNDVLGSFYEQHLSKKGVSQYFTPYPICLFMASSTFITDDKDGSSQRILDPCCGSGRMLLAAAETGGKHHKFYGIDVDPICVQMTTINLFLNGMFSAEIMCADALSPESFNFSYRTSFLPFGVFRIMERGQSILWQMHQNSFGEHNKKNGLRPPKNTIPWRDGSQLHLF